MFSVLRNFVMLSQFAKRRFIEHIVKLKLLLCWDSNMTADERLLIEEYSTFWTSDIDLGKKVF
jgi:hypothetical protein